VERAEWIPVEGSRRIVAEAYLPDERTILVRFRDGVAWAYQESTVQDWEDFTSPAQSRGSFIHAVLNHHPHGPWPG